MMIRVNLLPVEGKGQKRAYMQLSLMVAALLCSLGVIAAVYFQQQNTIAEMKEEIRRKEGIVAELQEVIRKVNDFERNRERIGQKLEIITANKRLQKLPVQLLVDVVDNLPDPIWLTSLSIEGRRYTASGYALTYRAVGNMLESIEGSRFYMAPELNSAVRSNLGNREVVLFTINFLLDGQAVRQDAS